MLRNTFFALCAVLVIAATSKAAIIVTAINPVDLGQGLTAVTLHAHSDSATQTINGIQDPNIIAANGGMGLHQVWVPASAAHTPTRASQQAAGVLWTDTYSPFDSYWLFDNTAGATLAVGAPFDESNSGAGGAVLPANGAFGVPMTGFGALNTTGGAPGNMLFTIASGKQGADVDFAHLVGKTGEFAALNLIVTTNQGDNQTIQGQLIQFGGDIIPEPTTITLLGLALAGCFGFIRRR